MPCTEFDHFSLNLSFPFPFLQLPRLPEEIDVVIIVSRIPGVDVDQAAIDKDRTFFAERVWIVRALRWLHDHGSPSLRDVVVDFTRFGADWVDGSQYSKLRKVERGVVLDLPKPAAAAAAPVAAAAAPAAAAVPVHVAVAEEPNEAPRASPPAEGAGGHAAAPPQAPDAADRRVPSSNADCEDDWADCDAPGIQGVVVGDVLEPAPGFGGNEPFLHAHAAVNAPAPPQPDAGGFGAAAVGAADADDDGPVYAVGAAEDDGQGGAAHAEHAAQAVANAANSYVHVTSARGVPVGRDTPDFFAKTFPWLFYDGKGDFACTDRPTEGGMTFRQWALSLMRSEQDRFRKCPYFVAILNNLVTRDQGAPGRGEGRGCLRCAHPPLGSPPDPPSSLSLSCSAVRR